MICSELAQQIKQLDKFLGNLPNSLVNVAKQSCTPQIRFNFNFQIQKADEECYIECIYQHQLDNHPANLTKVQTCYNFVKNKLL